MLDSEYKIGEVFEDPNRCIMVPEGINPEDIVNLFDCPDSLSIIINYKVPIICLKDYRDHILSLLRELDEDVIKPINEPLPDSRTLH